MNRKLLVVEISYLLELRPHYLLSFLLDLSCFDCQSVLVVLQPSILVIKRVYFVSIVFC